MDHDTLGSNYFAYLALLMWVPFAIYLYSRLSVALATLWTILGGYLLLPVGTYFKFNGVPITFDKRAIPSLAALIGCTLVAGRSPKFYRGFGITEVLILVAILAPIMTSTLNGDPLRYGPLVLDGVGPYDGVSSAVLQFTILLPFFLGRQFLRSSEANAEILRVLAIAGLVYSLPMLFEIRMSPQLHGWLYGFAPHVFFEQLRDGGYRPMVFIGGGLQVAFFVMMTAVAASALWRTRVSVARLGSGPVTAYLSFVMLLCKTLSALAYAVVLVPLVRFANPRQQLRVACVMVVIALSYPTLRLADYIPVNSLLNAASLVSVDRAASLGTRFKQEKQLLVKALKRPWFGWGRYGRSRVYDQSGTDVTITDGYWVDLMGSFGVVTFCAVFGLLGLSVFRAARALRNIHTRQEQVYFAALALIVAVNVFDLLPNTTISPLTWLLVGALLGRGEALKVSAQQQVARDNLQPSPA